MLPTFYQTFLSEQLKRSDWLMVQTLVWLLQEQTCEHRQRVGPVPDRPETPISARPVGCPL
ncbi:hypothetical protein [Laspinema olomoucense]|uniref:hypothetical protein n=1 Tax=Laspinema olomoucense TaxID=3231600 RepID=UPI0021BAF994|nr:MULTISPECIES: hypothetical protein [unclassified Laspinema]MCT7971504.1 hypothetical protein [Laspinema sp. D3d]MCT7987374.1 hypothetical protein [Laspinema sp. D3a]